MADVPTIRTLAKLAGVSSATVSLALRNHPRIRPQVRERIQKIAAEAGYRLNAIVSHLIPDLQGMGRGLRDARLSARLRLR